MAVEEEDVSITTPTPVAVATERPRRMVRCKTTDRICIAGHLSYDHGFRLGVRDDLQSQRRDQYGVGWTQRGNFENEHQMLCLMGRKLAPRLPLLDGPHVSCTTKLH